MPSFCRIIDVAFIKTDGQANDSIILHSIATRFSINRSSKKMEKRNIENPLNTIMIHWSVMCFNNRDKRGGRFMKTNMACVCTPGTNLSSYHPGVLTKNR